MNKNHSEISSLLKNFHSTQSLYDEIHDSLKQIKHLTQTQNEKTQKILETNKTIDSLQEKISLTQNSINTIHSSDDYKKYLELKNTLNMFHDQKSKIKNQINTQFTKISRPLSRYEYASSLDKDQKNILSTLVSEPFDVLVVDNKDSVIIILENIRKAVLSGSISVKDSDKTSFQITEIEESIDGFINQISEYHKKHEQMKKDLDSLIHPDLLSFEDVLAKTISLKDESQSKCKLHQSEIDEITSKIPKLISEIEGKLRKFSNTRYTVIKS